MVYYEPFINKVLATLKSQHEIHIIVPTLPLRWIVNSGNKVLWILWWQCRYNFVTTTSNSQRFLDVGDTILGQHLVNFDKIVKLDSLCSYVKVSTSFPQSCHYIDLVWYARRIL